LRDYEVEKIQADVSNEFLLVLDSGEDAVFGGGRAKGAYYKNLERKITVKKKRVNVSLDPTPSAKDIRD